MAGIVLLARGPRHNLPKMAHDQLCWAAWWGGAVLASGIFDALASKQTILCSPGKIREQEGYF
jgi:hypothetical protein